MFRIRGFKFSAINKFKKHVVAVTKDQTTPHVMQVSVRNGGLIRADSNFQCIVGRAVVAPGAISAVALNFKMFQGNILATIGNPDARLKSRGRKRLDFESITVGPASGSSTHLIRQ
jgi:hypothetical protein